MLFDYNFKRYNFRILIYVILLSGIGVMAIWSATNQDRSMIAKQIFGIILGLILAICLSLVDYTRLLSLHVLIYGACVVFLAAVLLMGRTAGGATRWLILPVIGAIQPAEFVKIGLILFFSWYFQRYQEKDQSAHYSGSWSCTVRTSCLYDFGAAEPFHNSGYYGDHCVGCILFRCQLQVDFRSSGSAVSPWSGVCIHAPV